MISLKLDHLTMLHDEEVKEKMCTRRTAQYYPGNKQNFLNYFAQKFFPSVVGCFEGKTNLCKYGSRVTLSYGQILVPMVGSYLKYQFALP